MDIKTQYNQIGKDYIEGQQTFFSQREDWGRKLMLGFMPDIRDGFVVDMGCGDGTDVIEYLKLGVKKVIGIDSSKYMLEQSVKRVGKGGEFLLGDYENIPIPDCSADIVAGRYSMHYLESFDTAYQQIARVLKPGGTLVLLLPHPMGDFFMQKEKNQNGKEIVLVPLYNEKVTVKYPVHSFAQYFSDDFFKLFTLENFREFIQEEVEPGKIAPTAMVIRARKK